MTKEQWRVLDRIGARDPAGIKHAMRQHKVDNIPDLVAQLELHNPKPKPLHRLKIAFGRIVGGYNYDPHEKELRRAFKYHFDNHEYIEVRHRIKKAKQNYDG